MLPYCFKGNIISFLGNFFYNINLVMIRTIIEAAFLWLQFYLFGFEVPMVYNCHARPCPTVTECWVSRAYEKTIFLYFMFIIGMWFLRNQTQIIFTFRISFIPSWNSRVLVSWMGEIKGSTRMQYKNEIPEKEWPKTQFN